MNSNLRADRSTALKLGRTPGLVALFCDLNRLISWLVSAMQKTGRAVTGMAEYPRMFLGLSPVDKASSRARQNDGWGQGEDGGSPSHRSSESPAVRTQPATSVGPMPNFPRFGLATHPRPFTFSPNPRAPSVTLIASTASSCQKTHYVREASSGWRTTRLKPTSGR